METGQQQQQQQQERPRRRKVEDVLVDRNKQTIRRLLDDAFSKGDIGVLDRVVADNVSVFNNGIPAPIEGIGNYRAMLEQFRRGFPDLRCEVSDLIGEGDYVSARWLASGTHQGDLMGIPGTGRRARDVSGVSVFRLADGKVIEERTTWDVASLLAQLGVGYRAQVLTTAYVDEEKQVMTTRLRGFEDAFNHNDAKAIADFFLDEATLVSLTGKFATGRPDIEKIVAEDLESILKGGKSSFSLKKVRMLAPGLAMVDLVHEITGPSVPGGKLELHVAGVGKKIDDKWMWLDARPYSYLQQP